MHEGAAATDEVRFAQLLRLARQAKQAVAMKAVVAEGPEAAEVESPAAGTAVADGAGGEAQGVAQGPAHRGLESLKDLV